MTKDRSSPLVFFVFIISFLWIRIFASHSITFLFDREPLLIYTKDYLLEHFLAYGGIADLFSQFITQFFITPWLGALVLSIIISSFIFRASSINRTNATPVFLLWILALALFTQTSNALVHIIAFSMILSAIDDQESTPKKTSHLWLQRFITLPLLIWAAGSWAWLYVVMIVFRDAFGDRKFSAILHFFIGYAAILGLIVQRLIWPMPIKSMLFDTLPFDSFWGIAIFVIGIATLLYPRLPRKDNHGLNYVLVMSSLILFIVLSVSNLKNPDRQSERWRSLINKDRFEQVIKKANKHGLDNSIQTMYLNCALAQENRTLDEMFSFPQSFGNDGLLHVYNSSDTTRDLRESWFMGQLYFDIGYYSKAANIANNEFLTSGLTPTNTKLLIRSLLKNGQPEQAEAYLEKLRHTLFYRKWAKKQTQENSIVSAILTSEKPFSNEALNDIYHVFQTYPSDLTFNYLCAYHLLEKQMDFLVDHIKVLRDLDHTQLPRHYQEAILIYQLDHPDAVIDLFELESNIETIRLFNELGESYASDPLAELNHYHKKYRAMYAIYWLIND